MPGLMPLTREEDGGLVCEVLWVDRYGNVQLNVDPDEIDPLGGTFEVQLPTGRRSARRAHTFTDIGTGSIGLIIDSYGLIALAANQSSAAEELGLAAGDGVTLKPLDDGCVTGPDVGEHPVGPDPRWVTGWGSVTMRPNRSDR